MGNFSYIILRTWIRLSAEKCESVEWQLRSGDIIKIGQNNLSVQLVEEVKELSMCIIDHINEPNVVFEPCGHLILCAICSKRFSICPKCEKPIERKILVKK